MNKKRCGGEYVEESAGITGEWFPESLDMILEIEFDWKDTNRIYSTEFIIWVSAGARVGRGFWRDMMEKVYEWNKLPA